MYKRQVRQLEGEGEIYFGSFFSMILAGFAEEIMFRLGIQNYIAQKLSFERKYWIAVLLTTLIWTSGHTGVLEPDWVKLVQVFPFGIALGWLFIKHGAESCILAHMVFNVSILYPGIFLIE